MDFACTPFEFEKVLIANGLAMSRDEAHRLLTLCKNLFAPVSAPRQLDRPLPTAHQFKATAAPVIPCPPDGPVRPAGDPAPRDCVDSEAPPAPQKRRARRAYKLDEIIKLSGVRRTAIYEEIKKGRLRAVKRGRATLVLDIDFEEWLQSLPPIVPSAVPCTSDYKQAKPDVVAKAAKASAAKQRRALANTRRKRIAARGSQAPPGE